MRIEMPALPATTLSSIPQETPKSTWGSTITGCFSRTLCNRWELTALTVQTFACLFFSVFTFFSGYSVAVSLAFLVGAVVNAVVRRHFQGLGSLAKQTNKLVELEGLTREDLYRFGKENDRFADRVVELGGQLATHKGLVDRQAEAVTAQEALSADLRGVLEKGGANLALLDQMIDRATGAEAAQLRQVKQVMEKAASLDQSHRALAATQTALGLSNRELLNRAEQLPALLRQAEAGLAEKVAGLGADVQALQAAITRGETQVEVLGGIAERLSGHVDQAVTAVQQTGANARVTGVLLQRLAAAGGAAGVVGPTSSARAGAGGAGMLGGGGAPVDVSA